MTDGPAARGAKVAPAVRRDERRAVLQPLASRPIRTVLLWQALATLAGAAMGAVLSGRAAAGSAALGGAVTVVSTLAYALMLGLGRKATAGESLVTMLRAEGVKIVVVVAGLYLALTRVHGVVTLALIATFVVTVLLFSVAFLARDR
jgi:ATP synthase protein I